MHEPIQFHRDPGPDGGGVDAPPGSPGTPGNPGVPDSPGSSTVRPKHLDLIKDQALTIRWSDGRVSVYPIPLLRKLSPSADARELRKEIESNPLTVLPTGKGNAGPLTALGIDMVGNYAVRIRFSDGHETGIYTWEYLRQIDPTRPETSDNTGG
jgi:DUF971 family protein